MIGLKKGENDLSGERVRTFLFVRIIIVAYLGDGECPESQGGKFNSSNPVVVNALCPHSASHWSIF